MKTGVCWCIVLVACSPHAVQQDPQPPVSLPAQYASSGTKAQSEVPKEWWKMFGDEGLNALVQRGLRGSFRMRGAWARLQQASAMLRGENANRWPQLTLNGSAGRSVTRIEFGNTKLTDQRNQFQLSLGASYEVDLWKRLGSRSKAAVLDAAAARDDLEALAMSLVAEISEAWFDLVSQRAQHRVLGEQLETNQRLLDLVRLRFREGLASALDVYQQQQQLVATRAQLTLLDSVLTSIGHRLAVLVGQVPSVKPVDTPQTLPALPPVPGIGVPADLLERRPDVRAARRRVEAADHRVAAAVSERLPGLRLSGSTGLQDSKLSELIAKPLWSILAAVTQPLFDGGRRKAETMRNRAIVKERVSVYGQVLLEAMTEVESALAQERGQLAYIKELTQQVQISESTLREAQARYRAGLSDYLPVLSALQVSQQNELMLLQAERQAFSYRVQLCRALGGTWTRRLTDQREEVR